ncbi:MAG: hypothetical protein Q7R70_04600 [Candidatus Diapherotrites archaeon]|nr:hypothetical protein [Candidatus Diapherotrites archaeon]
MKNSKKFKRIIFVFFFMLLFLNFSSGELIFDKITGVYSDYPSITDLVAESNPIQIPQPKASCLSVFRQIDFPRKCLNCLLIEVWADKNEIVEGEKRHYVGENIIPAYSIKNIGKNEIEGKLKFKLIYLSELRGIIEAFSDEKELVLKKDETFTGSSYDKEDTTIPLTIFGNYLLEISVEDKNGNQTQFYTCKGNALSGYGRSIALFDYYFSVMPSYEYNWESVVQNWQTENNQILKEMKNLTDESKKAVLETKELQLKVVSANEDINKAMYEVKGINESMDRSSNYMLIFTIISAIAAMVAIILSQRDKKHLEYYNKEKVLDDIEKLIQANSERHIDKQKRKLELAINEKIVTKDWVNNQLPVSKKI